jgi:hypothetical protein
MNTSINTTDALSPILAAVLDDAPVAPNATRHEDSTVCAVGAARSATDKAAAVAAGFAPADPVFERGTRVIQLGVDNAKRSRLAHDAKPTVREYCADLVARIAAEKRTDRVVGVAELGMNDAGQLTRAGNAVNIGEDAFLGFMNRLGVKGARYLVECKDAARRALNVRADLAEFVAGDAEAVAADPDGKREPARLNLRLRKTKSGPECFAVTSEKYAAFDADKIAQAIAMACPPDARGTVVYDGRKTKFEIVFHSDVQPQNYVAGEYFKAGVHVSTDDTGGGGIKVRAMIFQNLCLNLIILDESTVEIANLRHIGSVEKLAKAFEKAFAKALQSIDHFLKQWGYATEENLVETTQAQLAAEGEDVAQYDLSVESVMAGIFNGVIEDGDTGLPKRNRLDVVEGLMTMWEADASSATSRFGATRAALVNAITRWAHEVNDDHEVEVELQEAAGRLLASKKPLPFKALPLPGAKS